MEKPVESRINQNKKDNSEKFSAYSTCKDSSNYEDKKYSDLLLVIDMQNAYTKEGPWTCPHLDRAADHIITLIQSGRFEQIIFTRFDAPQQPVGTWANYNTINREINENHFLNGLIPQLLPFTEAYSLYSKSTYSSLSVPEIRTAVTECIERGSSVVLTGVVSECCVLATAFHLIDLGCPVIYITDACAGVSDQTEEAVITVLSGLDYVQTEILDTAGYLTKKSKKSEYNERRKFDCIRDNKSTHHGCC